jgi:hypothetical protein
MQVRARTGTTEPAFDTHGPAIGSIPFVKDTGAISLWRVATLSRLMDSGPSLFGGGDAQSVLPEGFVVRSAELAL